jgi:hypothetical protein
MPPLMGEAGLAENHRTFHTNIMKGISRRSTPTHTPSNVQVRTNVALDSLEMGPRVTFKTVEFHIHALILGDNPAVSVGPPLSIGWEAVTSVILDLDAYETARPPRQDSSDLVVPRAMRVDWLREEGCARSEMARVENEIKVIKKHRLRNARKGFWEIVGDVFRSFDRSAQDDNASVRRRRRSSYSLLIRASLSRQSVSVAC